MALLHMLSHKLRDALQQMETFILSVQTTQLLLQVLPLGAGLESEQGDVAKAAEAVNAWAQSAFSFDGDYHVRVHGYVKYYGITFEIDEEYPPVNVE